MTAPTTIIARPIARHAAPLVLESLLHLTGRPFISRGVEPRHVIPRRCERIGAPVRSAQELAHLLKPAKGRADDDQRESGRRERAVPLQGVPKVRPGQRSTTLRMCIRPSLPESGWRRTQALGLIGPR